LPLICLASPKGGVGKTTLAANLAHALRRAGWPVVALDLDPQNALRLHFGIPLADTAGFLAEPGRDWRSALRPTAAGVDLLPHGTTDLRGALATAGALEREPELIAAPLRALLADPALVVVADTPPGPSHALSALAPLASLVIAVLLADAASTALLPDIESGRFLGRGTLGNLYATRLRVVLNQVDYHSRLSIASAEAMAAHLGPRLLGAVARDEALAEALACQRLLAECAPASAAAQDIADIARGIAALLHAEAPGAGGLAWRAR